MNTPLANFHQASSILADADLASAGLDGSDGWGGLIALALLVATILFAMYIAAREEWQVARGSTLQAGMRVDRARSLDGPRPA